MKRRLLIFLGAMACLQTLLVSVIQGQDRVSPVPPPIEVRTDSKRLRNGDSLDVGKGDWLRTLSLRVTNVSDRNIISFNIQLVIDKRPGISRKILLPVIYRTVLDERTDGKAITDQGRGKVGPLVAGETVTVSIDENSIAKSKEMFRQLSVPVIDISDVQILIQSVWYEDGSRWAMGTESMKSPKNILPDFLLDLAGVFLPRPKPVFFLRRTWHPEPMRPIVTGLRFRQMRTLVGVTADLVGPGGPVILEGATITELVQPPLTNGVFLILPLIIYIAQTRAEAGLVVWRWLIY